MVDAVPGQWRRIDRRRQLIVLVHGYNSPAESAESNYELFLRQIRPAFRQRVCRLFWPGELNLGFLSALSYSWVIPKVHLAATLIAEHLLNLSGPESTVMDVAFVGHSLGCRLILEAVRRVAESPHVPAMQITRAFLMAPAVPVELCGSDEALGRAAQSVNERRVYCSGRDMVLRLAFPAGQALAFWQGYENRAYYRAVGSHGNPVGFPTERIDTRLGHSKYWKDREVQRSIVEKLHLEREHTLPSRGVPSRPAPQPRRIHSRRLSPFN